MYYLSEVICACCKRTSCKTEEAKLRAWRLKTPLLFRAVFVKALQYAALGVQFLL